MTAFVKDPAIMMLLERINLNERGWEVIDHWDGDACAVGIARKGTPRRLVYVSTFGKGPDRYAYECETPSGPSDTDYEVATRGDDVGYVELFEIMRLHLDP